MLNIFVGPLRTVPGHATNCVAERADYQVLASRLDQRSHCRMDRPHQASDQIRLLFETILLFVIASNTPEGDVARRHETDLRAYPAIRPLEQMDQRAVHRRADQQPAL